MTDDVDVLPDVLGPGWTARTLPLRPDGGTPDPVATLVHREGTDTRRALLYVHGFVDYFFQTQFADALASHDDGYGYDIVRRLRDAGLGDVGDASVYGTLRRLYAAGALSSYVVPSDGGPHRKYYAINSEGRDMLSRQRVIWSDFAGAMSALLAETPPKKTALRTIGENK